MAGRAVLIPQAFAARRSSVKGRPKAVRTRHSDKRGPLQGEPLKAFLGLPSGFLNAAFSVAHDVGVVGVALLLLGRIVMGAGKMGDRGNPCRSALPSVE